MLPLVTLQFTDAMAVSPLLVSATAMKSAVWPVRIVMLFGETTSCATVPLPVSVTRAGISHANTTAAARSAGETATTRSLISARRADNLCLKVINPSPRFGSASRREEFAHVGCAGRRAREHGHAEPFQRQPQRALVLVQRGGLVAELRLRTDGHPHDPPAPVGIVAARLVEHDDEQPVLLERRALDQRVDVVLEPGIGGAQP